MNLSNNPIPARLRGEFLGVAPESSIPSGPLVKGTAPSMTSDLSEIIELAKLRLPDLRWEQISVSLPADDDGLWFFWIPGAPGEVQIESGQGVCPFLIETDKHDEKLYADSPQEVANTIFKWLTMPGGRQHSPWHSK